MTKFYKLLHGGLKHFDFTYKEGLNVDHVPFDPSGQCKPGGLYFTTVDYFSRWLYNQLQYVAEVTLPSDARVYPEPCGTAWKADRIVLGKIQTLSEFFATLNEATLIDFVTGDGSLLKHIQNQTTNICMAAVQSHWAALQYVKKQTEAICLAAVRHSAHALAAVNTEFEAQSLALARDIGWDIKFHKHPTVCVGIGHGPDIAITYIHQQCSPLCGN